MRTNFGVPDITESPLSHTWGKSGYGQRTLLL